MRYEKLCLIGVLLTFGLAACGESADEPSTDKGDALQAPVLTDGKADGLDFVQSKGTLTFGGEQTQTFEGLGEFHAFTIEMGEKAKATIEVSQKGTNRRVDTTMYLFGPKSASGSYGKQFIAFDDDSGWGTLSRIRGFEPGQAGEYLVLIGTFTGRSSGKYRLTAACDNGQCEPKPKDPLVTTCVFGTQYQDIFGGSGAVVATSSSTIGLLSQPTTLEKSQVLAAVQTTYDEAKDYNQALGKVDGMVINKTQVWDASNRTAYVAYEFGAGDNSYGAIFDVKTATPVALIQDGDLAACTVFWGQERRPCSSNNECATGLRCNGIAQGQGACLNPVAPSPSGDGDTCTTSSDCPDTNGLVCAGESKGGGLCNQAWMKRTFLGEVAPQGLSIPDNDPNGVTLDLSAFGLATVSTDEVIDLWVSHPDPSQVTITLTNPSGTEVVVFDGSTTSVTELVLDGKSLRGFPGDEDVNGTWKLKLVDTVKGGTGALRRVGLHLTSRWD